MMRYVADNIHILNESIAGALDTMTPDPIVRMTHQCLDAGADALNVNAGPDPRKAAVRMAFMVECIQSVTDCPILVDSANSNVIEAGLRANKKKAVINGVTLQPFKRDTLFPLAAEYQTDVIVFLLKPDGHVPLGVEDRLDIAIDLFQEAQRAGIDKRHLIIDPVVVPLTWPDGPQQAKSVLTIIRQLPDFLGFPVKTIAGLSNLTSGHGPNAKKRLIEKAYAVLLYESGLSMALFNIFHRGTQEILQACRALLKPGIFSWEDI